MYGKKKKRFSKKVTGALQMCSFVLLTVPPIGNALTRDTTPSRGILPSQYLSLCSIIQINLRVSSSRHHLARPLILS